MKITLNNSYPQGYLCQLRPQNSSYYPPVKEALKYGLLMTAALLFISNLGYSQPKDSLRSNTPSRDRPAEKEKVYKKNIFGNIVVEDGNGWVIATIKKDIFGNDVEEDDNGKKRIYKKNIFGDKVVEDENGRVIATFKKDIFGNLIEEDDKGRKMTYKKNIFGDTVVEDESGRVVATYKKGSFEKPDIK